MGSEQRQHWQDRIRRLKVETYTLYLACKDPRVPWYAKAFAACVVAYALSPLDLIPDFVPVLGYLDDLILVPLGIVLALKMIPAQVLAECRMEAVAALRDDLPRNWAAAGVIAALWALSLCAVRYVAWRVFAR